MPTRSLWCRSVSPCVCLHSRADGDVPYSYSERYVVAATAAGGRATLTETHGDHFTLIDPASPDWAAAIAALQELLSLPGAVHPQRSGTGPDHFLTPGQGSPRQGPSRGWAPAGGASPRARSSSTSSSTSSGTCPPAVQSAQRMPTKLPMPV